MADTRLVLRYIDDDGLAMQEIVWLSRLHRIILDYTKRGYNDFYYKPYGTTTWIEGNLP